MTFTELQAAGARDRWPDKEMRESADHVRWWIKDRIRGAVEVANARGLALEELAQELIEEMK